MRKIILFVLAISMGAASLAGCGSSKTEGIPANDVSAAAESGVSTDESGETAAAEPDVSAAQAEVTGDGYTIAVEDAETGDPIEDVMVQLCTETECRAGQTGADGRAIFEAEPGDYTAHVVKVPKGYEKTDEELVLSADKKDVTFKLKKAAVAPMEIGTIRPSARRYRAIKAI